MNRKRKEKYNNIPNYRDVKLNKVKFTLVYQLKSNSCKNISCRQTISVIFLISFNSAYICFNTSYSTQFH